MAREDSRVTTTAAVKRRGKLIHCLIFKFLWHSLSNIEFFVTLLSVTLKKTVPVKGMIKPTFIEHYH